MREEFVGRVYIVTGQLGGIFNLAVIPAKAGIQNGIWIPAPRFREDKFRRNDILGTMHRIVAPLLYFSHFAFLVLPYCFYAGEAQTRI